MFTKNLSKKKISQILEKIELIPVVFPRHISRIVESIELLPWMYQEMIHCMQIPINISPHLENYQVPMEIDDRIPHLRNGIMREKKIVFLSRTDNMCTGLKS